MLLRSYRLNPPPPPPRPCRYERDSKVGFLALQAVQTSAQLVAEGVDEFAGLDDDADLEPDADDVVDAMEEDGADAKPAGNSTAAISETPKLVLPVPAIASSNYPDWTFFLHNLKPLSTNSGGPIKTQILRAIDAVAASKSLDEGAKENIIKSLE